MKLARVKTDGRTALMAVLESGLLPLDGEAPMLGATISDNPLPLLADPAGARALLEARLADGRPLLPVMEHQLEAPVLRPSKMLAIGMNYAAHVQEIAERRPAAGIADTDVVQIWFNKQVSCLNPPFAPIVRPRVSDFLDYEGELAFVVGRKARHVAEGDALGVVGAYCVANDVSVRDWQRRSPTMTMGKSFDTHGPVGPWLTLADSVPDPQALRVRSWVNGSLRQDFSTAAMVHPIARMIAHLSQAFTLEPGDVILTGTGAGAGALMQPPNFLVPGDRVRVAIDGLGAIEAAVIAEPTLS